MRLTPEAQHKLSEAATLRNESIATTLEAAVDLLYRQTFLDECDRAYDRLKADPKAWRTVQREGELWDVTLADGLGSDS